MLTAPDTILSEACDDEFVFHLFTDSGKEIALIFVKQTVFLSGMENRKAVQALYTGAKPEDPCYAEELQFNQF